MESHKCVFHSILCCLSLIADAYFKGIREFDVQKAYRAMRQNAFEQPETYEEYKDGLGRRALDSYLHLLFIRFLSCMSGDSLLCNRYSVV
ncbi:MAG: glycoside hydrolase family 92 protein [Mediterranea sp.]|nr:glycoside hydrolase family 92 protein [Mediterranea sp.]